VGQGKCNLKVQPLNPFKEEEMIKTWWHCLIKTYANMKGQNHRMIKFHNSYSFKAYWFCTCGYNKPEFLND
jgi:hypothetical protein